MDLSQVMPSGCNLRHVAQPPDNQLAVADRPSASLLSSGTERDDTDDEICSFDLGPEPFDPTGQNRLPSDEWLDDHQQGLEPGGSEPKQEYYSTFKVMPQKPSLLGMMRNDMEEGEAVPPQSPERALTPTIGFAYDYTMECASRHSTHSRYAKTLNTISRSSYAQCAT